MVKNKSFSSYFAPMSINNLQLGEEFDRIVDQRRSVRIYDTDADFDSSAVTRSLQRATLAPNSSNLQLWEFFHIKSDEAKKKMAEYCLGQPAASTANELVVFVTRQDLWKERADWNLEKVVGSMSNSNKQAEKPKSTRDTGDTLKNIGKDKDTRKKSVMQYYGKLIPQLYKNDAFGIAGAVKKAYVNFVQGPKKPAYREVGKEDVRVIVHKSCALAAQTFMLSMTAEGYSTCPMEGFDSKRIKKFLNLPSGAEIGMVVSCGVGKQEGVYGKRLRVNEQQIIKEV